MDYFENEKHYVNWFNKLAVDKYGKGITPKQKGILKDIWNSRYLHNRLIKFRIRPIHERVSWDFKEFIQKYERADLKKFFKHKELLIREIVILIRDPKKYENCKTLIEYSGTRVSEITKTIIEQALENRTKFSKNDVIGNISNVIEKLIDKPGVYKLYDKNNKLCYIGRSFNLADRVLTSILERDAYYFSYIITKTNADATILEPYLITKERPYKNADCVTTDKPTFKLAIPKESEIFEIWKKKNIKEKANE